MGTSKSILVIDDDVDFQLMIGVMLRSAGYIVKTLLEGKAPNAVHMASDCDLVLLDIELPGTNGVELGKELKSSPATLDIPIILLSGHHDCENLFVESRANAYLLKPFSLHRLMTKIKELLKFKEEA
jgi:CheY-like chemotaxis protein